jgi:hypothetical protein
MGVIAVTAADERKIAQLAQRLGFRSRQRVVRAALAELERRATRKELRAAIRQYVRQYGALDRDENATLSASGSARAVS